MPGQKLREYANFFKFDVQALKSLFKVSELNMVIKRSPLLQFYLKVIKLINGVIKQVLWRQLLHNH